ncbi:MAG: NAD(P)/FAD-dependent oxidoreductase [Nevskiales bacterium]|nr:NAD(P)/FAD-dependent oxidoreductase [Nevskiales bacterium]
MRRNLRFLVLGAGMSGILAGIRLKQEGLEDFEILEMAGDVGGTWRDNTYPGLSCDVPAHTYGYSFERNWRWTGFYASGPELGEYFRRCAHKYGLMPHVRLNTRVTDIRREHGRWVVESADGQTREADIVINCFGVLCHPKLPDIPGLKRFKGAMFHSARWDHSVPLDGRRIGVVGTGSTAAQITAALAPRAGHYSLFQRTAQWVAPAYALQRSEFMRGLHRIIPGFSRLTGKLQGELFYEIAKGVTGDSDPAWRAVDWLCRRNLARVRDPELRRALTPDFKVGCRRLIFCDGFYEAIEATNAELVTAGIKGIEAGGIRTVDGRLHELDVLVLATGFHALNYTYGFEVTNDAGARLSEQWTDGARALHGVAVSGFPNYFMLIGPHSPVGNFSLTAISEIQMDYLLQLIEPIRRGEASAIAADPDAERRYYDYLGAGMAKTVWSSGCNRSWYLGKDGQPQLYPYPPTTFVRELATPDLSEFVVA